MRINGDFVRDNSCCEIVPGRVSIKGESLITSEDLFQVLMSRHISKGDLIMIVYQDRYACLS